MDDPLKYPFIKGRFSPIIEQTCIPEEYIPYTDSLHRRRPKASGMEADHGHPPGLIENLGEWSGKNTTCFDEPSSEDECHHERDRWSIHLSKRRPIRVNSEYNTASRNKVLGQLDRPLIVLDLNGVLCYRHRCSKKAMRYLPKFGLENFKVGAHMVYLRPFAKEFIKYCLDNYHLGFLTSTTKKNAEPILKRLIPKEDWSKVKFFWYRDHTQADPEIGTNPLTPNHSTIKKIDEILASKEINPDGIYNYHNVTICDDSKRKLRFVPPKNYVLVGSFNLKMMINGFDVCNRYPIDGELLRLVSRLHRRVYGMISPLCSITRSQSIA